MSFAFENDALLGRFVSVSSLLSPFRATIARSFDEIIAAILVGWLVGTLLGPSGSKLQTDADGRGNPRDDGLGARGLDVDDDVQLPPSL